MNGKKARSLRKQAITEFGGDVKSYSDTSKSKIVGWDKEKNPVRVEKITRKASGANSRYKDLKRGK